MDTPKPPTPILTPLLALLSSRKFLLALAAFIGAAVARYNGAIDTETFINATVALVSVLSGLITVEDVAKKQAEAKIMAATVSAEVQAHAHEMETA